jgi:predicted house-cleaning NTP pyrophosphatase (Maf/HAM1 superfamily)
MQTLILPGISKEDKNWVDETAKNLKTNDIVRPFYWMHWTDENSKFDVQEKAGLIVKHIKGDKVNIIAKDEGLEVANIVKSLIPEQVVSVK